MSRITRFAALSCLWLGASLGAAWAQQGTDLCGKSGAQNWDEVRTSLVGHWKITHLGGYARAGAMIIPFPPDPEQEVLTIALIGEVLEASHPEMQAPMVLQLADEPIWTFESEDPAVPKPSATFVDLQQSVDCDQANLPRIIGTTSAMVDGTRMDFVNRLLYTRSNELFGVMEATTVANGVPVRAVRTVHLQRQ